MVPQFSICSWLGRERLSIQNIYVSDDYCEVENQLDTISLSRFRQVGKQTRNFSCHNLIELRTSFGEHLFSKDATFSENPPFLTSLIRTRTHTYQGIRNVNFSVNFAYVLMNDPLRIFPEFIWGHFAEKCFDFIFVDTIISNNK